MAKPDFSKIFAQNGAITALTDSQFLQGFDYLGDNPPTKEEFNWLFQQLCLKLQFLDQQSGAFIRQPNKAYAVGDIAYSPTLPSWARLECVVAGTTATIEPVWPVVGEEVTDGTVKWRIRDIKDGVTAAEFTALANEMAGKVNLTDFTSWGDSVTGGRKLPDGTIIQWGLTNGNAAHTASNVIFPIAFPTAVFTVSVTPTRALPTSQGQASIYNITTSSFTYNNNSADGTQMAYYFAVGE